MVVDILQNAGSYTCMKRGFEEAFRFFARPDLKELKPGRHEIDGTRVYAVVMKAHGKKREDTKLEAHDKYIDIQCLLAGSEKMGWKVRSACGKPAIPYNPEKDIVLFDDEPDTWLSVEPGGFAIFFPHDAHLPMISNGEVHKVVVKIAVG